METNPRPTKSKPRKAVPAPIEKSGAVQYISPKGEEIFLVTMRGRRPDVTDSLRVFGMGPTRELATAQCERHWFEAYNALRSRAHAHVTQDTPPAG